MFNFRGAPGHLRVQRIVSKLSSSGTKIPPNFIERFTQAESIFFHHIVFNASKQACEFLIDGDDEQCIPDIFQRVQKSLGIKCDEVNIEEPCKSLHTIATSTSSFLGAVLPADVAHGIYNGSVCPRTLRRLLAVRTDSDAFRPYSCQQSGGHQGGIESGEEGDAATGSVDSVADKASLPSPQTKCHPKRHQQVQQPSPETVARKLDVQAKQRDSTFKSLMSVYAKAETELHHASQSVPSSRTTNASWLLEQVAAAPVGISASRKRTLDDREPSSSDPTGATPTTTSFRDLVGKNRQSSPQGQQTTTANAAATPRKALVVPATRLATLASSAKKLRSTSTETPSTSKAKAPPSGSMTLLHFFQKK